MFTVYHTRLMASTRAALPVRCRSNLDRSRVRSRVRSRPNLDRSRSIAIRPRRRALRRRVVHGVTRAASHVAMPWYRRSRGHGTAGRRGHGTAGRRGHGTAGHVAMVPQVTWRWHHRSTWRWHHRSRGDGTAGHVAMARRPRARRSSAVSSAAPRLG